MSASSSDMFMKVGRATATTLSAPGYTVGNTTINVASTTNYPTDTGVFVAVDEVDSSGERISGSYNVFRGVVSSATQISSLVYQGGDANRNYSAGATTRVYIVVSSYQMNRLIDGLLVAHNQDGTIKPQTDLSLITPKITTSLNDTNGNELIKVTPTASAVNEITVTNAAAGSDPSISATGADTNIDLNLKPKGTGHTQQNGRNIDWWEELGRTTLSVAGDTLSVSSLPARKYLKVIISAKGTGLVNQQLRFNNDVSSNYFHTVAVNGAAASGSSSQNQINITTGDTDQTYFTTVEILNVQTWEKLLVAKATLSAAGVSVATMVDSTGKWVNTADYISRIDLINLNTGDFAIGSEVVVLGHD